MIPDHRCANTSSWRERAEQRVDGSTRVCSSSRWSSWTPETWINTTTHPDVKGRKPERPKLPEPPQPGSDGSRGVRRGLTCVRLLDELLQVEQQDHRGGSQEQEEPEGAEERAAQPHDRRHQAGPTESSRLAPDQPQRRHLGREGGRGRWTQVSG